MTTGVVVPFQQDAEKKAAYAADITYSTNNELGFDYLRDNMKSSMDRDVPARAQLRHRGRGQLDPDRRGAHAADHLGPQPGPERSVSEASICLIPELTEAHFKLDEKTRNVTYTDEGNEFIEQRLRGRRSAAGRPIAV